MTKTTRTKPQYAWDNPDIPHTGWIELCTRDLETPDHVCEMCGKEEIRYVHTMVHAAWTNLDVGEICAGHMSGNYAGPKESKRVAKNLSNNKLSWFLKSKWEDYPNVSYRMTQTITAVLTAEKHSVWSWRIIVINGQNCSGYAANRVDAKQRSETAVQAAQTIKRIQ